MKMMILYWPIKIDRKLIKYSKWLPPWIYWKSEFWFSDCCNLLILHRILIRLAKYFMVYYGLVFQIHLLLMTEHVIIDSANCIDYIEKYPFMVTFLNDLYVLPTSFL